MVDVRGFSLDGKQNKSLRQSVSRVRKAGYHVEMFDPSKLDVYAKHADLYAKQGLAMEAIDLAASKTYTKVPLTGLPPLVLTMPDRLTVGGLTRLRSWVVVALTVMTVAVAMTIAGAEARGLQRLYVALTRAVSRLTVVHSEPLPEPLPAMPGPAAARAAS